MREPAGEEGVDESLRGSTHFVLESMDCKNCCIALGLVPLSSSFSGSAATVVAAEAFPAEADAEARDVASEREAALCQSLVLATLTGPENKGGSDCR